MLEKYLSSILTAVTIAMLVWAGVNIQSNGKSIARLEVKIEYVVRQMNRLMDRNIASK